MLYEWFRDFARSGGGGELDQFLKLSELFDKFFNSHFDVLVNYDNRKQITEYLNKQLQHYK